MTPRPRVVVTHRIHGDVLDLLETACTVVPNQTGETLAPDELRSRCARADALMAFMPDAVDRAFLADAPHLRIIAGALRGWDNFDVAACTERGVWFTVVPDLLADATAELGAGLLLALARRIVAAT